MQAIKLILWQVMNILKRFIGQSKDIFLGIPCSFYEIQVNEDTFPQVRTLLKGKHRHQVTEDVSALFENWTKVHLIATTSFFICAEH